ncbi:hypothetical protein QVD17_15840 [Tagetes erecta]|uniref:Uncharacterized protein n=1 Tax=Tagetes erecta TaxID=13708 RepID=A0AAD8NZZ9_TARER|nr:hypothetical protein QVD17_15840 [Tagetes erecta]
MVGSNELRKSLGTTGKGPRRKREQARIEWEKEQAEHEKLQKRMEDVMDAYKRLSGIPPNMQSQQRLTPTDLGPSWPESRTLQPAVPGRKPWQKPLIFHLEYNIMTLSLSVKELKQKKLQGNRGRKGAFIDLFPHSHSTNIFFFFFKQRT